MFRSIEFEKSQTRGDITYHTYNLRDSRFSKSITIAGDNYARTVVPEICIISEYSALKEPVARSLALFYLDIFSRDLDHKYVPRRLFVEEYETVYNKIKTYRDTIEIHFPEFNYAKTYYSCVIRQMKQLSFGNGFFK